MTEPALVYCPEETDRADQDQYLYSRELYRYDDLPELAQDRGKAVLERPILRRLMTFTNRSGVPVETGNVRSLDHEPLPEYLVVDHLGTLGPDATSQVAVVGAFMGAGVKVIVDYQELTKRWYFDQVKLRNSQAVYRTIAELLENPPAETCERWWQGRNPCDTWFLATTHCPVRSYDSATRRIHELVHGQGLTPTAAVRALQVAGYRNREGRVRWYPRAVQDVLKDGS